MALLLYHWCCINKKQDKLPAQNYILKQHSISSALQIELWNNKEKVEKMDNKKIRLRDYLK